MRALPIFLFIFGMLLMAIPAFADTYIVQYNPSADYELRDPSPTIVASAGTAVTNDLTIVSKQGRVELTVSIACHDDVTLDRSCEWVRFSGGEERLKVSMEPLETRKVGYTINIPPDAKETNYRFNFIIQQTTPTDVKIRTVPIRIQAPASLSILDIPQLSVLGSNVELPRPCLRMENVTMNGTTTETCVQKISAPLWVILLVIIGGAIVVWRVR